LSTRAPSEPVRGTDHEDQRVGEIGVHAFVFRAQTHRAVETFDAVVEPPSIDAHQAERAIAAVVVGTDRDRLLGELLGELQRRDLEGR
jgi:hypothetical protein